MRKQEFKRGRVLVRVGTGCVCVCVRLQMCRLQNATEDFYVCARVSACHNMLHNSTHTIFLLHQMNQFLQNFIQQPEEAERRGKTFIIIFTTICTADSLRGLYLPLMLKFFPSIRCLREGCLENAGTTASKSASKPAHAHTHTHNH